jgi:uncharacterized protein (TIGR02231 family)
MKRLLAFLGALCAVLLVSAAPVPVDSAITAVTVYTDRAVVTRTGSVDLPGGITELTFANLPQALNEHSLQVSGKGTAQAVILDVASRQTYVDFTPNARVKELEDQLRALQKQLRGLDDRNGVLQAQSVMLDRMETALFAPPAKDVPRPDLTQFTNSLTYLSEQKTRLINERTTLEEQREEFENKSTALQNQLNELRGAGGRGYKTVTVRVSAPQAGTLAVALSYTVPGASWVPSYDARVLSTERAVQLGYFGVVRQSTGEDWKDVALTLSTARPGFGGAAPALTPWNLDLYTEFKRAQLYGAMREDAAAKSVAMPAAINMQSLTSNAPMDELDKKEKDAELAQATIESGATSASFKIATSASVPSDNSPQKVPITSARLAANPEYLTVPKRLATAFLTTKVFNTSEFPLLSGAMNVFLDGTFVATSGLRTVMPGEKFDLALGADEAIAVKYKRVNKFTESTGLTSSGKRITYEYLLTVQNNKRTAEHVIVADQVPLSRNEKITVKLLAPETDEVKPTDEGTLKWALDLKPGEKRELTVKFAVEYANEVNVVGLE